MSAHEQLKADLETLDRVIRDGREATPLVKRTLPAMLAALRFVEAHGPAVRQGLLELLLQAELHNSDFTEQQAHDALEAFYAALSALRSAT